MPSFSKPSKTNKAKEREYSYKAAWEKEDWAAGMFLSFLCTIIYTKVTKLLHSSV